MLMNVQRKLQYDRAWNSIRAIKKAVADLEDELKWLENLDENK